MPICWKAEKLLTWPKAMQPNERTMAKLLALAKSKRGVKQITKYYKISLSFWVSYPALHLVSSPHRLSQRSQCCKKKNTSQQLYSSNLRATKKIFDPNFTYPSWQFYWIWRFVLFKSTIGEEEYAVKLGCPLLVLRALTFKQSFNDWRGVKQFHGHKILHPFSLVNLFSLQCSPVISVWILCSQ